MLGLFAALVALVAALGSSSAKGASAKGWQPPDSGGLDTLRTLAARAGLSEEQTAFLALVAYGESRFNNLVGLGIPSLFPEGTRPNMNASASMQEAEARAARKAYDRNASKFSHCGWPADSYGFGSGGWFGLLPANGLAQLTGTGLECLGPYAVFDPAASLVMAYAFARGLQGWDGYQALPTPANLRAGWGWPAKMGDAAYLASKRKKFEGYAQAIGLPVSFLDQHLPRFPKRDLEAMYDAMQGGAVA